MPLMFRLEDASLVMPWSWLVLLALPVLVLGAVGGGWAAWRHHRAIAELRDTRAQLRSLADLLDVWQWQTDQQHCLTLLRPPQGATTSQWAAARPHQALWELFHTTDVAALLAQLDSHVALNDIEVCGEAKVSPHSPPHRPLRGRLRAQVRMDASGAFAGYVGTLRELETVAAPASASPVAPSGGLAPASATDQESFGYTVSHDLRAPVRVVEGFTRIVKEDYGHLLDRIGNDHLERVLGAAARMNSMIDALLALSKLSSQPLARQPVNLSQLAGYVADDLRRQSPERAVDLHIEPGLQVLGDPTLLRVVLENLLGNAWKYTGKRSDAQIWFERSARDAASFSVRDNGAGFDMRFADRLFGVFQRLHSANDFQGTGVGLASVRRIVRRHGGEIWAESEVDNGASFHFSLPQDGLRA
jgi:signal transduction histidine kinase